MTDELDLAPIRARLAAATEGPWKVDPYSDHGNTLVTTQDMPICGTGTPRPSEMESLGGKRCWRLRYSPCQTGASDSSNSRSGE